MLLSLEEKKEKNKKDTIYKIIRVHIVEAQKKEDIKIKIMLNRKEYLKKWRFENKEKIKEYSQENSEKLKERARQWNKENREKKRKSDRLYNKNHRELRNYNDMIRRMRLKNIEGNFTLKQWQELKEKCNFTCLCCEKPEPEIKLSIDHIIPITKNGTNWIDNIQSLCRSCNSMKGNKVVSLAELKILYNKNK